MAASALSSSSSETEWVGTTCVKRGLPSVRVPVLSTTRVSTFSIRSMAAGRPQRAGTGDDQQPHRVVTTAWAMRGSGSSQTQAARVSTATPRTVGTNQPASSWIGAQLRWAWATIEMICESTVSLPTRSASTRKLPGFASTAATDASQPSPYPSWTPGSRRPGAGPNDF